MFNGHPAVYRSALVGVKRGESTVPVVCVELQPGADIERGQLFVELSDRARAYPHTECIEHFMVHPGFPVDVRHNAKIRRETLARWATGRLS
ncbi:MAG: hypothetical protein QGG40_21330 [Myxococcota bacterium]|nr:hypothetical protein [Myxococcota bacterium]